MATAKKTAKLSEQEFVLAAIKAAHAKTPKYDGCHTVYSGFNAAFREYYGEGSDPVAATTRLAEAGVIVVRPARGGAMLYTPDKAPAAKPADKGLLEAMGV